MSKLAEILSSIVQVRLLEPGHSYYVRVLHDSWCPSLQAGSVMDKVRMCTCKPDIQIRELPESEYLGKGGAYGIR